MRWRFTRLAAIVVGQSTGNRWSSAEKGSLLMRLGLKPLFYAAAAVCFVIAAARPVEAWIIDGTETIPNLEARIYEHDNSHDLKSWEGVLVVLSYPQQMSLLGKTVDLRSTAGHSGRIIITPSSITESAAQVGFMGIETYQ